MNNNKLKLFDDKKISAVWDADKEEWYFSVVDVVAILTDSDNPRKYWSVLKTRLKDEGSEVTTNCSQLKMLAPDGKNRLRDAMDTKGVLRLIQSIPSPKAEPFKVWLAQVGSERLDEISDPEKAILRGAEYYRKKGYSDEWINQRLRTIEIRKKLTDEWRERGITENIDFAILTNDLTQAWSGMSVKEYKAFKGLTKENLRDNMTDVELVLNMLAEVSTTALSKQVQPKSFEDNRSVARSGGNVAKVARENLESKLGRTVISAENATDTEKLTTGLNQITDGDKQ